MDTDVSAPRETAARARDAARGHTAAGSLRRRADVLVSLTHSDLRARYGRGPWQLLKWLADPFALVGIYLLLKVFVLDRPGVAPGLTIACAVVPFQLVMMSVVNGLGAIQLRSSIILNMRFDRSLVPLSGTLTETVAFAASLPMLALMMAVYRVAPTPALLWLPVAVVLTFVFSVGCAHAASLLSLWVGDLRAFAISFVRALFFLAPGLVALPAVDGGAQTLLRLNPLSGIFESYRAIFIYGHRPAAWMLLVPLAATAVLLAACVPVYRVEQHHFAKVLG